MTRSVTPEIINIIDKGPAAAEHISEAERTAAYIEGWTSSAEKFDESLKDKMIARFGNDESTDQVIIHQLYEMLDETYTEIKGNVNE